MHIFSRTLEKGSFFLSCISRNICHYLCASHSLCINDTCFSCCGSNVFIWESHFNLKTFFFFVWQQICATAEILLTSKGGNAVKKNEIKNLSLSWCKWELWGLANWQKGMVTRYVHCTVRLVDSWKMEIVLISFG